MVLMPNLFKNTLRKLLNTFKLGRFPKSLPAIYLFVCPIHAHSYCTIPSTWQFITYASLLTYHYVESQDFSSCDIESLDLNPGSVTAGVIVGEQCPDHGITRFFASVDQALA